MHANKRRCVEKALLGKFKDKLVEVFGRHPKRVHQGRLNSAGYFGNPAFVVTTFDDVDFGERHEFASLAIGRKMTTVVDECGTIPRASGQPLRGVPSESDTVLLHWFRRRCERIATMFRSCRLLQRGRV